MVHFLQIARNIDVVPLRAALAEQPWLWGQHPQRACAPDSPHRAMSDIWVRYNDPANAGPAFHDPHDSVWYPAYAALPELQPLIFGLMHLVGGERLGGVLLTKIPPGSGIDPHIDANWHADYYEKFTIAIQNPPGAVFQFPDAAMHAVDGDAYWFDNSVPHSVRNDSSLERIALIICIQTAQFKRNSHA